MFGHNDNWNWLRDQFLVKITQIWLQWLLELVAWPIFGKKITKIWLRLQLESFTGPIPTKSKNWNWLCDQFLVNITKIWSHDQFLVKFTKNKKPDGKGLIYYSAYSDNLVTTHQW